MLAERTPDMLELPVAFKATSSILPFIVAIGASTVGKKTMNKDDYSSVEVARVTFQIDAIAAKVDRIEKVQNEVREELNEVRDQANKWKGAFIVILALGGILGWIASVGSAISKWLK